MKKEYIAPKFKSVMMNFEGMIAESYTGSDGNGGLDNSGAGSGEGSNRRHSIWGDEY